MQLGRPRGVPSNLCLRARLNRLIKKHRGCWLWTAFAKPMPTLRINSRSYDARRLMYKEVTGKNPGALRNVCGNNLCVRPKHNPRMTSKTWLLYTFWERVNKRAPGECWPWLGASKPSEYGDRPRFTVGRKVMYAYRWIAITLGKATEDQVIRHTCDNTMCVNPGHLAGGTQQDNVDDMIKKNRHMHGESHTGAKLTDVLVVKLRRLRVKGLSFKELGQLFGVSASTAFHVCSRKIWSHVP